MNRPKKNLEHFFKCPSCDIALSKNNIQTKLDIFYLDCVKCNIAYLTIDCFYFFNNPIETGRDDFEEALINQQQEFLKSSENYEQFLKEKEKRELGDLYAAFQPFNESTKAFYPFINLIKNDLDKNDIILDTWCRTGYSAAFLSSTFPDQQIVSIWEGDNNVLGYSGFNYWFKGNTDNITIIFTSMNEKLPINNDMLSFVHGLDSLHRYDMDVMLPELLRVAKKEAPLIFPHIHLTNSEPDPFFDRGCLQIHGNDYENYFEKLLKDTDYKFSIHSEPEMFKLADESEIESNPNMQDYNALACILSGKKQGKLIPFLSELSIKSNFIINPILNINFTEMSISLDKNKWNKEIKYMLDRHPVYEEYLNKHIPMSLSSLETQILFLISQSLSAEEIINELKIDFEEFKNIVRVLLDKSIIELLNCSKKLSQMQQSFSSKKHLINTENETLSNLWKLAVQNSDSDILFYHEDEEISYEETDEIVSLIASTLLSNNGKKGDVILYYGPYDYQVFFLIWACALTGIIFTAINEDTPYEQLTSIVDELNVKFIFTEKKRYDSLSSFKKQLIILNDDENETGRSLYSIMEEDINLSKIETIYPDDLALILFSSGTTGKAKGIPITNGSLYRSSHSFSKFYDIQKQDRIFSLGDLSTMSGLRNPAFIPLHTNASIICPHPDDLKSFVKIAELIRSKKASVLTTTPSSINTFYKFKSHFSFPNTLKRILCTGSRLSLQLSKKFYETFKIPIYNYYGLTESCGFILASSLESYKTVSIGKAIDCIASIVDENGNNVAQGEIGYLRIYSRNITKKYLISNEDINIKDNWFYTGDFAYIDKHNNVNLEGRSDDAFKDSKGNLIHTEEIERCIEVHPKVLDVAVKSTEENGKALISAFLVHKHNELESLISEIQALVHKNLGESKCPQNFIQINELPRGVNGKILKNKL